MIVGLTGGIGSGKSAVAALFRDLGVNIIDADQIAHELMSPDQPSTAKIIEHFGPTILNKEGSINRSKLRSLIFESMDERRWLEALLHPLIKTEILGRANMATDPYVIVEIPLLIEAHFLDIVDRVLVVDCSESTQLDRVARRDAIPRDDIQLIIKAQADRETRLSNATDIIDNEGSLDLLKNKVLTLHQQYTQLSK